MSVSGLATAPEPGGAPDGVDVVQSSRNFTPGRVERQESDFKKDDVVCITHLQKEPKLNWRLGVVVKPPANYEDRVGVRLLQDAGLNTKLHGLKPINIFTIPRDITPTMITNLIAHGVSESDGRLLVKHFDFKYTPPSETQEAWPAAEPPKAERAAGNSSTRVYPDGSVRSFTYTPDMTQEELLEKCFEQTALHAAAYTGEAPPTAPPPPPSAPAQPTMDIGDGTDDDPFAGLKQHMMAAGLDVSGVQSFSMRPGAHGQGSTLEECLGNAQASTKYQARRPPVRKYKDLDEVKSIPDKLKEWYGTGGMTSSTIVAYIENRVDFITPPAAVDYGIETDSDWQRVFERVVGLLERGENAARVLHQETLAAEAAAAAAALAPAPPLTPPEFATRLEELEWCLERVVESEKKPPPPGMKLLFNSRKLLEEEIRKERAKAAPPPLPPAGDETGPIERASAVVAANSHAEVGGSQPGWDDEQKALALASFAAVTGVPVEQAVSEAHRRYGR